ncbi:MAG: hypothetical protein ABFR97_01650 [Thermodesulfobacteriota bacterium]
MSKIKQEWDKEMAMAVLENPSVDSETWASAVEWLLLYGPPEIKDLLSQASATATEDCFPKLTPTSYSPDGQPLYDIKELAQALGLSEEETRQRLEEREAEQGSRHLFGPEQAMKVH